LINREHLQNNRQLLLKSLEIENDAAQVLLIATQILFQSITQTMIKVSGKFVSILLGFLQKHINEHDFSILQNYHGMNLLYTIMHISYILRKLNIFYLF